MEHGRPLVSPCAACPALLHLHGAVLAPVHLHGAVLAPVHLHGAVLAPVRAQAAILHPGLYSCMQLSHIHSCLQAGRRPSPVAGISPILAALDTEAMACIPYAITTPSRHA